LNAIALHIGERETSVTLAADMPSGETLTLPLGFAGIAAAHFRHDPPSEAEMENAAGSALRSADPALREIALLAGVAPAPAMVLSTEAMERVFDRLAAVVTGSSAARQGIPAGREFAATLLILREFMHHLRFTSITCAGP
jgi:hypothetical protein